MMVSVARFDEQVRAKAAGDEEAMGMDEDFIQPPKNIQLERGLPPC